MTKKRIAVIVLTSPIILTVLVCMALAACVGYACTGRWELKQLVQSWAQA